MESSFKDHIANVYLGHLTEIYSRSDQELMARIKTSTENHIDSITQAYFEVLRSVDEGTQFLNSKNIDEELASGLLVWISNLFVIRNDKKEILKYIDQQFLIGKKYVRMNMPPHLLNLGARVLKMDICNRIIEKDLNAKEARNIYTQVTMLIDICMSITVEAYLESRISTERSSHALQNHILGSELAETCQNIRAEMHDWHSTLLNKLLVSKIITLEDLPAVNNSLFCLWIRHKANVFFKDTEEVKALNQEIDHLEEILPNLVIYKNKNDEEKLLALNKKINIHIKKMGWLLSALTKQARSLDSGRDTLTKLYNRRYLDVILQKETSLVYRNNSSYILLMLDVDNFKHINDTHGHHDGDKVIECVASLLHESVRTSDYLFRYGGDEFLILMVDATIERAKDLANDLIRKANSNSITSNDNSEINISLSIGIAKHDGESDYMVIINKADKALLDAKKQGRNRYSSAA
jgi:diguanylate cyclase